MSDFTFSDLPIYRLRIGDPIKGNGWRVGQKVICDGKEVKVTEITHKVVKRRLEFVVWCQNPTPDTGCDNVPYDVIYPGSDLTFSIVPNARSFTTLSQSREAVPDKEVIR